MAEDASRANDQPDRATSAPLVLGGVALTIVVIVVAFIVDADTIGIPVLILAVICLLAAGGYRLLTARGGGDSDSTDNIPRQEPRGERPLGDTPEAHDEINPHDLPKGSPERDAAEEMAGGTEGTTRGPLPGG